MNELRSSDYEVCPRCKTGLLDAPGIGPYCPNKECPVLDNISGAPEPGRVGAAADGWTSVADGMPPPTTFALQGSPTPLGREYRILVATKEGRVFETILTALGFANLNSRTDQVTHWMPLPNHPRAAEKFSEQSPLVYPDGWRCKYPRFVGSIAQDCEYPNCDCGPPEVQK